MTPEKRQLIRRNVRFFYDVQRLRVQTSNRTADQQGHQQTELDEQGKAFMNTQGGELSKMEAEALAEVKRHLKGVPIYEKWLKKQAGCGPTMSGVLLAEIDIARCTTPSQLWAFCGLAVNPDGSIQRLKRGEKSGFNPWLKSKVVSVLADCMLKAGGIQARKRRLAAITQRFGDDYLKTDAYKNFLRSHFAELTEEQIEAKKGPPTTNEYLEHVIDTFQIPVESSGGWVGLYENYKHRKTSQMVPVCMNCGGTGKSREKAKGVKGGRRDVPTKTPGKEIVCGNCAGTGGPAPWGRGAANRNMAAKRYMIKMFLLDLWKEWRALEGLPVVPPYSKAYLGMEHGDHGPKPELLEAAESRRLARFPNLPKKSGVNAPN